jgi:phosphoribosylanthranilate isomerase
MPVRVKICGLTNLEDALASIDAGADALGFIFYPKSPRYLTPEAAAAIITQLPPFVSKVGVFVDESHDHIREIARSTGIDTLQLHGNETPDFTTRLQEQSFKVIKAFRIKDQSTLSQLQSYRSAAFLLDSYVPGQLGGTGAKFNWDLALQAKSSGIPIILAGGLDPENIADAVSKVAPFAVDVSSGVEATPGRKDLSKVRDFITRARKASYSRQ